MKSRNVYMLMIVVLLVFVFMIVNNREKDYISSNRKYSNYSKTNDVLLVTLSDMETVNYYRDLEKDASKVFLNYDFNEIIYNFESHEYVFIRDRIISIYDDFSEESIKIRYDSMSDDHAYLGHVSGYDIFDHNLYCLNTYEVLYECEKCTYEIKCSDLNKLLLHDGNDYIGTIREGLDAELFHIDELFYVNVDIIKEDK